MLAVQFSDQWLLPQLGPHAISVTHQYNTIMTEGIVSLFVGMDSYSRKKTSSLR